MRIAAVLGGAGGIGRAIVETLHDAGLRVYVLDQAAARPTATPERPDVPFLACDLCDAESIAAAFQALERQAGRLDVCINAAGAIQRDAFVAVPAATLDRLLAVNVRGAFLALQAAARLMMAGDGGRIVCLASMHGLRTSAERSAYALCKGAILALTRALAVELAPHGILVNAVAPGPVSTGMQDAHSDSRRRWQGATPLGRVATAAEVARAVAFLAAADNTFITGETLIVDGGANVAMGSVAMDSTSAG